MCTKHRELFTALAAPFAAGEIKTRPQGGRQLRYVTARTIMNRLDAICGPENWWDDYTPLEHSVICRLSVRLPEGQVLTKSDAGGEAGMADLGDNDKSGFSDAFKRAAVKFGPGRYLYNDGVPNLEDSPGVAPIAAGLATGIAPAPHPGPLPQERELRAPALPVAQPQAPAETITVPPLQRERVGVRGGASHEPSPKPGAEDAQGRGGKLAYGQAAVKPKALTRPHTGQELHYYAMESTIDPGLGNWIVNSFNPQGFPVKIVDWTPDEVRRAWPSIREHLETVKQARARMKASA